MRDEDPGISNLIDLNGERIVLDETKGLWVKFEAKRVSKDNRSVGIRYSLTLHNKHNERILGFDNAHEIEYGAKKMVKPKRTFEHVHLGAETKPYNFINAGQLLEDFWQTVDDYLARE